MSDSLSRRDALKQLVLAGGTVLAASAIRIGEAAGGLPHLKPEEPTAVALGYVEDASKVDAKKNPTYKPDQKCSNCVQLTGKAGDVWRPCNLFPGKLVHADGWCKVWVKKA